MKKYNTPEIEALALETIDVIATSGDEAGLNALKAKAGYEDFASTTAQSLGEVKNLGSTWSW